jgi:dUTP pyrophosphatase
MATKPKNKKARYRRGDKAYYAKLAVKSVDSRNRRHIQAEVARDPELNTTIPTRKRESDAGYDVSTPKRFTIAPGEGVTVGTGVRVKCPKGYFFEVRGRSSLTIRGIEVLDAVIDATYTGEVRIHLVNRSSEPVAFKAGDRVAQLIFLPQIHVEFLEVEDFKNEGEDRGEAGFGSTGT